MPWPDKLNECRHRADPRHNQRRSNLAAVRQHDTSSLLRLDNNPPNRNPCRDGHASSPGRPLQRPDHGSHAANRNLPPAGNSAKFACKPVVEPQQRGRRVRSQMHAQRRIKCQQPLQPQIRQMLIGDIRHRHQQHAHELAHLRLAHETQRQSGLCQLEKLHGRRRVERRRNVVEHAFEYRSMTEQLRPHRLPARHLARSQIAVNRFAIDPAQHQMVAVG